MPAVAAAALIVETLAVRVDLVLEDEVAKAVPLLPVLDKQEHLIPALAVVAAAVITQVITVMMVAEVLMAL
jgi:hypothetical protein